MTEPAPDLGGERSSGSRIAVIDKAVRVLDVLVGAGDGLTPSEVAERAGVNRSTAFRLLTSLEQTALLARNASTGRYRLGMKMLRYGSAVRLELSIVGVAEPVLMRLRDDTQQAVLLAVREEWGARCVIRLHGPDVDVLSWRTGEWSPLHLGAAPRALMSALSEGEVHRYLAESRSWHHRPDGPEADDLRIDLLRSRERGWSMASETSTGEVVSLGAVVGDPGTDPMCAISVAGFERHYTGAQLDRTSAAVLAAADEIGRRLRG